MKKRNYFKSLYNIFSFGTFALVVGISLGLLFALRLLRNNVNSSAWLTITILSSITAFVIFFLCTRPDKNLLSKSVGYFDLFLASFFVTFFFATILCAPYFKLLSMESWIPFFVALGFFIVLTGAIIFRAIYVNHFSSKMENGYLMLSDIVDKGKMPNDRSKCILKDTPVNYDLLDRKYLIDRLSNAIDALRDGGTIAVNGKWGSGKTTIIQNALDSREDKIPYDVIDVWNYSDEKAFFTSVINTVYRNLDIGKDTAVIQSHLQDYLSAFLSTTGNSFFSGLFDATSPDNSIIDVINDYLVQNGKKLILIIDNLDRASDDFILIVYRTIAHLSKLKNVIYICVFDDARASKALNGKGIDYSFLEKIFSITIRVPNPDSSDIYKIAYSGIDNYFSKYFPAEYQACDNIDKAIIKLVINRCENLRSFIVLFNAISNVFSTNFYKINIIDTIAILSLRINCPDLVTLIETNPHMFVICHRGFLDKKLLHSNSKNELREEKKEFIEKYFSFDKPFFKYSDLLDSLFPNFRTYASGDDVKNEVVQRSNNGRRIYSGKYFTMYFNEKEANSPELSDDLKQMLSQSDSTMFYRLMDDYFDRCSPINQTKVLKEIIEILHDNQDVNKSNILWYMLSRYYWFSDYPFLKSVSARELSVKIIAEVLRTIGKKEITWFLDYYERYRIGDLVLMDKISDELLNSESKADSEEVVSAIPTSLKLKNIIIAQIKIFNGLLFYMDALIIIILILV